MSDCCTFPYLTFACLLCRPALGAPLHRYVAGVSLIGCSICAYFFFRACGMQLFMILSPVIFAVLFPYLFSLVFSCCKCFKCIQAFMYTVAAVQPPSFCCADLQLYVDGHRRGTSTDQEKVIVRWGNVLQWFSVRASWVHSIEIRNFSEDFAGQHDCPPGASAVTLHCRRPVLAQTSGCCHFLMPHYFMSACL